MTRGELLNKVAALADPARRPEAARELAGHLGARELIIFIPDQEVGLLLPAPGFPQVLPDVKAWRDFTARAAKDGRAESVLRLCGDGTEDRVFGFADSGGSVLALAGRHPDTAGAAEVAELLPLLASSFYGELTSRGAESQAAMAREAAEQSRLLAATLDEARRTVQSALNEAKAANAAKDRFLAVLSHELRNPLSPVLLAASLLEADSELPPRLLDEVRSIKRNAELEARLIDDLLDITRITHGKLELHRAEAGGNRLLSQTVDMYRADAHESGVALLVETQATDDVLLVDSARLQQVFWNLIKNAIKFTPAGGSVTVRTFNDGAGRFCTSVDDTGIGIEPARLGKVFEAFDQGSADVTKRYGGLGLGLSISKAIVELHGGVIVAESRGAGRGSTFSVCLPSITRHQDAPGRGRTEVAEKEKTQQLGGRWKIYSLRITKTPAG